MTTTITQLTGQQPTDSDVFEFETTAGEGGPANFKATRAQILTAPAPASGAGINISLVASAAFAGSAAAGGNVVFTTGAGDGAGAKGQVQINAPGTAYATTEAIITATTNQRAALVLQPFSTSGNNTLEVWGDAGGILIKNTTGSESCGQVMRNSADAGLFIASAVSITIDSTGSCVLRSSTVISAGIHGSANGGWFQNTGGEGALASNFTNATATMAATNILFNVIAGRSYRITGILQVSNSTAAEGVQIDFNGGTATATTFFMAAQSIGSVVVGTVVSTALAGVINYTTITGTDYIELNGYIKVNAGGTLVLRAAENTHSTGTLTIGAGSWIALNDTVPL